MENMGVLKVVRQVEDEKHTYSLMESSNPGNRLYVHINNDKTNQNSNIVPLEELSELLTKKIPAWVDGSKGDTTRKENEY